jgi:hypothetical protein
MRGDSPRLIKTQAYCALIRNGLLHRTLLILSSRSSEAGKSRSGPFLTDPGPPTIHLDTGEGTLLIRFVAGRYMVNLPKLIAVRISFGRCEDLCGAVLSTVVWQYCAFHWHGA